MFDIGLNLTSSQFAKDRDEVVARAFAAGVKGLLLTGTNLHESEQAQQLAQRYERCWSTAGVHPHDSSQWTPESGETLRRLAKRPEVVAIGECGLDFFVEGLDAETQQQYFDGQLRLAREFDLPVIVHARRAVDAVIASIRRIGGLRGVVHSFSGSPEQARQLWQLGFLIGLGGPVTYERANRLRTLARTMPLDYLLLETDAPDQPDAGIRGQRNEPARLPVVRDVIAGLRGITAVEVSQATTRNAERLFNLPPA